MTTYIQFETRSMGKSLCFSWSKPKKKKNVRDVFHASTMSNRIDNMNMRYGSPDKLVNSIAIHNPSSIHQPHKVHTQFMT